MESSRSKILLIALGVVALAAALLAKPAYRAVRSYRAESLAAQAESAVTRQAWPEASQKAQAAYQLDPTNPHSIRVVARLYTIAGQPNALVFWKHLRATGKATAEDRRELVRAGLRFGKAADVREEAVELGWAQASEDLRLAAEYFLITGETTNALRLSRELLKAEPGDKSELLVAQALLALRTAGEREEARAILQQLAGGTNSTALDAQALLAKSGMAPDEKLPQLIKSLSSSPDRQLSHRLLAEELRLRAEPAGRAGTITNVVAEFSRAPLRERLEVARWLNRQREFAAAVTLLPPADALTDRDAFLVRVDALAALGRWKEARAAFENPSAPVEPILRELYLARTAQELNMLPEVDAHWRRVHMELATRPEAILYVAEYAEKIGELDHARRAWERLTAVPEFSDRAFAGMIRIAEQRGGTRTLREIMRDLSARRPEDPAPLNDYAYLNLLLNERVDTSKETAQKLFDGQTNVMAFRTTLALALLRSEEFAAAKKLYDGLELDWSALKPGWQAVHAAVVGAAGEAHLARALGRQIPLDRLKPEEKALVQPWL